MGTQSQEHTPGNSYRSPEVYERIVPNLPELPSSKSFALTTVQAAPQHCSSCSTGCGRLHYSFVRTGRQLTNRNAAIFDCQHTLDSKPTGVAPAIGNSAHLSIPL